MKKRVAALILGLFFILNALPCAALDINPATDRDFDVPCQAAILIDEDSAQSYMKRTPTSPALSPPSPRL